MSELAQRVEEQRKGTKPSMQDGFDFYPCGYFISIVRNNRTCFLTGTRAPRVRTARSNLNS